MAPSRPTLSASYWADRPLTITRNEAVPTSRDATARALTFPSLGGQDRSRPPWGRLHGFRSVTMINTLQLTRATRLCLALSERVRIYEIDHLAKFVLLEG